MSGVIISDLLQTPGLDFRSWGCGEFQVRKCRVLRALTNCRPERNINLLYLEVQPRNSPYA